MNLSYEYLGSLIFKFSENIIQEFGGDSSCRIAKQIFINRSVAFVCEYAYLIPCYFVIYLVISNIIF